MYFCRKNKIKSFGRIFLHPNCYEVFPSMLVDIIPLIGKVFPQYKHFHSENMSEGSIYWNTYMLKVQMVLSISYRIFIFIFVNLSSNLCLLLGAFSSWMFILNKAIVTYIHHQLKYKCIIHDLLVYTSKLRCKFSLRWK